MLATLPAGRLAGPGRGAAAWRRINDHPVLTSAVLTALGAAGWIVLLPWIGTDLSAAVARADWAARYPGSAYLFTWYGGISPASYSLLAPYALAAVGTRLAMAIAALIAATLATWLLVRHRVPRPGAAALWVSVSLWTELSAGRAAFTLGVAAALACVAVVDVARPRGTTRLLAAALAGLTCAFSPVAALFLGVAAVAYAYVGRRTDGAIIAASAVLPLGAMAWFSDGGVQPIGINWIPSLLAAGAVFVFIPRHWRMLRFGAAVYAIGVILACLLPTPVGSNAARLSQLLIGPLLVGIGTHRHRWLLALALVAAGAWQVAQPVIDFARSGGGPTPTVSALVHELRTLDAGTGRVEAVPQYGHWESQELASAVPLARGWERQVDVERNPLFYNGVLTASAYHEWLQYNAVRYVAISTSVPDTAAVAESAIIRARQPWLPSVWHDAYWQLYQVTDTLPLADPPATIISTNPAEITMRMSAAGTAVVRVHWSPLLRATGAVLARSGPWISVTVRSAGIYVLSAPY